MDTILVNKLPTRTWNRLGVNGTALLWDEAATVDGGTARLSADDRLELSADAPYCRKTVEITAAAGRQLTVYETFRGGDHLHVRTVLRPAEGASIRLVQVQAMDKAAVLHSEVTASCPAGSRVELFRLLAGSGDTYADDRIVLAENGASLRAAMGYLGRGQQVIDLNLAVDHLGRSTRSDIDVSGALKDGARKVFRGTIDFKNGSAGSAGSEHQTVPLILCAEESVEGTHGATIGALDDATLFYFESRGFDRGAAEDLMARAAVERLAHDLADDATAETVGEQLNGGL